MCWIWSVVTCALFVQAQSTQPNIILMLMDDMGWGDIGVNGNWAKETPNIDKMAAEGLLFTDFYSAAPICSPARASLMTGRLPIRNGFYTSNVHLENAYTPQNNVGGINETEILLPELLKEVGYKSKIIGKWHLGHQVQYLPLSRGFDEFFGSGNCHFGPYNDVNKPNIPVYKNDKMVGRYYTNFTINKGTGQSEISQIFLREGLEFIEAQHSADTPFFLYWTPDATHDPYYASSQFYKKSIRGRYGDAVMEMDYAVGVILQKLKDLEIQNNTFVFFTSDNGAATYRKTGGNNGPFLCGKLTTYEGGMREPAVAWWPGTIPGGKVTHQLASLMDLFTTSLSIAGATPPDDRIIDGSDIMHVLVNSSDVDVEKPIFYYRGNEMMAVRLGSYKANYWFYTQGGSGNKFNYCPGQYIENVLTHEKVNHTAEPVLFHLGRDPGEKYPIYHGSEYQDAMKRIGPVVEEHKARLVPGYPSLNHCDNAIQNWAPPGCEELDYCLPVPASNPQLCLGSIILKGSRKSGI